MGEWYNIGMNCIRCGNPLTTGKQIKYCSQRCCKLYLKSLYRKRNRDKIREYASKIRRLGNSTSGKCLAVKNIHLQTKKCSKCSSEKDLQIHHIKPRKYGGKHEPNNLILFCRKCHHEYENLTKEFWKT